MNCKDRNTVREIISEEIAMLTNHKGAYCCKPPGPGEVATTQLLDKRMGDQWKHLEERLTQIKERLRDEIKEVDRKRACLSDGHRSVKDRQAAIIEAFAAMADGTGHMEDKYTVVVTVNNEDEWTISDPLRTREPGHTVRRYNISTGDITEHFIPDRDLALVNERKSHGREGMEREAE